uniref:Secreted protein n=1 Tax=Aegilops tauschii subsp. strangulata TaxID=200361 RepID=A0A453JIN6_AEGTS
MQFKVFWLLCCMPYSWIYGRLSTRNIIYNRPWRGVWPVLATTTDGVQDLWCHLHDQHHLLGSATHDCRCRVMSHQGPCCFL